MDRDGVAVVITIDPRRITAEEAPAAVRSFAYRIAREMVEVPDVFVFERRVELSTTRLLYEALIERDHELYSILRSLHDLYVVNSSNKRDAELFEVIRDAAEGLLKDRKALCGEEYEPPAVTERMRADRLSALEVRARARAAELHHENIRLREEAIALRGRIARADAEIATLKQRSAA